MSALHRDERVGSRLFGTSRRAAMRREVVVPCQAVRERDFRLVADCTLDVSVDGLLLNTHVPVLTGESLIVSFEIPGMWIDTEATVARVIHGRRPSDDGAAVGVVFDALAPSAKAALAAFLHGRTAPIPRRGPMARLRRGEIAPALADEGSMTNLVFAEPDRAPAKPKPVSGQGVDGVGILRAVFDAWKDLIVESEMQSPV